MARRCHHRTPVRSPGAASLSSVLCSRLLLGAGPVSLLTSTGSIAKGPRPTDPINLQLQMLEKIVSVPSIYTLHSLMLVPQSAVLGVTTKAFCRLSADTVPFCRRNSNIHQGGVWWPQGSRHQVLAGTRAAVPRGSQVSLFVLTLLWDRRLCGEPHSPHLCPCPLSWPPWPAGEALSAWPSAGRGSVGHVSGGATWQSSLQVHHSLPSPSTDKETETWRDAVTLRSHRRGSYPQPGTCPTLCSPEQSRRTQRPPASSTGFSGLVFNWIPYRVIEALLAVRH